MKRTDKWELTRRARRTRSSSVLFVSFVSFVSFVLTPMAHAQAPATRAGRWEFSFAGPRGVQLSFDGVPILRQSSLNVVKPGWTGSLYGQATTTHRVQARAEGDAKVVTIDGGNDLFSAHYEVTLRPDHTAALALTYKLLQDVPAELEYCAGYFNANLVACRRYTADTPTWWSAGGTRLTRPPARGKASYLSCRRRRTSRRTTWRLTGAG
jgi:hypothetical protein